MKDNISECWVKVVGDMHEKIAEIARGADAFISLPGIFISCVSILSFTIVGKNKIMKC